MAGRLWSNEELAYLDCNWGKLELDVMAKELNRPKQGVERKARERGLLSITQATELLTIRGAAQMLKISPHTIEGWIKKYQLKTVKKALWKQEKNLINKVDLIDWLQSNTDKWSTFKMPIGALGIEPDWLNEKRQQDKVIPFNHREKYTPEMDEQIMDLYRKGFSIEKIAEIVGRTPKGVEQEINKLFNEEKVVS